MKRSNRNNLQFAFSSSIFICFAFMLILIPLRLVVAFAISAAVHEMFHLAAMRIVRVKVHSIQIGIHGAAIETEPMTCKQELFCSLAGPVGGLLLLLLFRWFPILALTAAVHSLYNLLPIYPTDGGRALRCCADLALPEVAGMKVVYWTEIITLSMITAVCFIGTIKFHIGILPVVFAATMLHRSAKRK